MRVASQVRKEKGIAIQVCSVINRCFYMCHFSLFYIYILIYICVYIYINIYIYPCFKWKTKFMKTVT